MLPDIIVTNFKRRVTGVSSTAINVTKAQQRISSRALALCGPGQDLGLWKALRNGWRRPADASHRIWHVRRNSEMLWGLIARDVLRQPVKLVFTSAAIRQHSALPRWLISKMDAVIATSEAAAAHLQRVDRIQGHGVDTTAFAPVEKTSHPTIVCVGRIREEKGTHILCAALAEVLPEFPDARAIFLGRAQAKDQVFFDQLKQTTASVAGQIDWRGEVSADAVSETLASAHILAATPLYEGYGLTAFEGLASGCAVLLSDTGAFAAAVDQTGYLVPLNDIPATARALRSLLTDTSACTSMMTCARNLAVEKFGIEQEAKAALEVYQACLDPRD